MTGPPWLPEEVAHLVRQLPWPNDPMFTSTAAREIAKALRAVPLRPELHHVIGIGCSTFARHLRDQGLSEPAALGAGLRLAEAVTGELARLGREILAQHGMS
jgi:hypothetical protein